VQDFRIKYRASSLPKLFTRFVYQKGYLEAFVSPKDFEDLLPKLKVRRIT